MINPVKKVFITQGFGDNPASYSKFGFKGHNGVDYRAFMPDGSRCYAVGQSEIFSPHNGTVIENTFDQNGYGWYVKIENDVEGSVLAHMNNPSSLKAGDQVKEGDFVGYQGLTGNTTGIHLHWGYYRKPRDKSNGYGGMIDQRPFINEGESMTNMYGNPALDLSNVESMKVVVDKYNAIGRGEYIAKSEVEARVKSAHDEGYNKGFSEGKDSAPSVDPTFDPSMWRENGYQIQITQGNKVITLNYERK